jgi:hypothetical protein
MVDSGHTIATVDGDGRQSIVGTANLKQYEKDAP